MTFYQPLQRNIVTKIVFCQIAVSLKKTTKTEKTDCAKRRLFVIIKKNTMEKSMLKKISAVIISALLVFRFADAICLIV